MTDTEEEILRMADRMPDLKRDTAAAVTACLFGTRAMVTKVRIGKDRKKNLMTAAAILIAEIRRLEASDEKLQGISGK